MVASLQIKPQPRALALGSLWLGVAGGVVFLKRIDSLFEREKRATRRGVVENFAIDFFSIAPLLSPPLHVGDNPFHLSGDA